MELEKAKKALNYQLNMRNTDIFMIPNFEAIETLLQALDNSIPKEKVKEGIESIEDYFDRLNGPDEDIDFIREVKQELLEE